MQVLCLIFILGMAHSWNFPSFFEQELSPNSFRGSTINNNSSLLPTFDYMNKMMAMMHQRFQRLFGSSSFSMNHIDDWLKNRKKLDAVEPVCTKTTDSPPTTTATTSMQKNRRKKFCGAQTTTCIKELIIDGKKQIYKETNVTDDKGTVIAQSKIYQTISMNTMNNTIPIDINGENDVISY
ncbi:unnamed protein product [Rotaria magnacalcarata]|uniref:Uncharacterized protein n=2 Tax=Rotaria magnacalcarata TaxID=392030 RepID=A0A820TX13_9BILA|nr:unnamed protein product [Rotaria magnacalcarata]